MRTVGMKYLIGLLAALACLPAQAARTADELMACVEKNVLPEALSQDIELEAFGIDGETRVMRGKLFTMREDLPDAPGLLRATLKIDSPSHLAGAAFLLKQTEDRRFDSMYVYLPAVKRVRRINTEFSDGPLLGTNFSYYEFKQLANAFGDLKGEVAGTEEYEGRKVTLMQFAANPRDAQTAYTHVTLRIDDKSCVVLNAEFKKGGSVRKVFSAKPSALKNAGNFWFLSEMQMRDLLDNTHTVLRLTDQKARKDLPTRYFQPNTFYLGD